MDNTQAILDYAQAIEHLRILLAERESMQYVRQVLITAKEAMERLATTEREYADVTKKLEVLTAEWGVAQQRHLERLKELETAHNVRLQQLMTTQQAAQAKADQEAAELAAKRRGVAQQHQVLDEALAAKNREIDRLQKDCRSWESRLQKAKHDFDAYKASLSHVD